MSADPTREKSPELQFDRAVSGEGPSAADAPAPSVTCSVCSRAIDRQYYNVNGATLCASCCGKVQADAASARGAGTFLRAGIFGLGAAIAGAIVYYAVIAITNLEIGIVAILIGFMVGWGVRKGASLRGGRRFQILAVVLTYWAVGLAYAPFVFKGMTEGDGAKATISQPADSTTKVTPAATDSASTPAGDSAVSTPSTGSSSTAATKDAEKPGGKSIALALVILAGLVFALPVMTILGTMPSGLISAFIIFIGMQQAWRMTAAPKLEVSGPYKIGGGSATSTG